MAPKRTFDHDASPPIRRIYALVYALGAVIALALPVGTFHHDAPAPTNSRTPSTATTIGGPR